MQETTHKSEYIMLVNVLSMLAVVYMHVNNCFGHLAQKDIGSRRM